MNKSDLKKLIKPLVKECINEVLLEEGLLSNVLSEVARGMQDSLIVEQAPSQKLGVVDPEKARLEKIAESRENFDGYRKKLMKSIGEDAYNGVNLFEGTEPMTAHEVAEPKAGQVDLGSPSDAGVDISSVIGGAARMWDAMK